MTNNTAIQETDKMKQQWAKHIEQGASMTDNFTKEMLDVSKMKVGLVNSGNFTRPPQPVGYWVLGKGGYTHVSFPMYVKPTPEQIENHKTMLGWDWVEEQA